ncbi:MAG: transposase, partial [Candidatus Methanomethylophilaceae archaeon]|nr:transposase [Candidatus Methanomethylophilaceae archaeon]
MMKTIKFRIEPNSVQRSIIDQMIDANRLVYNNMLTACKIQYEKDGTIPSVFDLNKFTTIMRHNSPYVEKAHSMTLQETSKRVHKAFTRTMNENRKKMSELDIETFTFRIQGNHYPRYRSFNQFSSIAYPSSKVFSIITEKRGRKCKRMLELGKIPGMIRCYNQSTPIDGMIRTCTIKRKDMGRYHQYFACITYEEAQKPFMEPIKGPVGVDIGISNIAALSDGTVFPNDHIFMALKKNLERQQRKLSRLSPGTKAYNGIIARINHIYQKIKNHRKNIVENISSFITRTYSHIVMEDLSVKDLRSISRNRSMTNGYNDAS